MKKILVTLLIMIFYQSIVFSQVGINTINPNSTLHVKGSITLPINYASGTTFSVTSAMHTIIIPPSETSSISLPSANGIKGRIYRIKNVSGGIRTISSYLDMNNNASTSIQNYSSIVIQSDDTNWVQIESSDNRTSLPVGASISSYGTIASNAAIGDPFSNGITIDGLLFQNINDVNTTGLWYDLRLTNTTGSTISVFMNSHNYGTEHEVNNVFNTSFTNNSSLDADGAFTYGSNSNSSVNEMNVRTISASGIVNWYKVESIVWNTVSGSVTTRHGLLNVTKLY